jgi:hypothetical protein
LIVSRNKQSPFDYLQKKLNFKNHYVWHKLKSKLQDVFLQIHLLLEVKDEDVFKINNSNQTTIYLYVLPHAYPITYMNGIFHVSLPILRLP